jgi:hypothetical protein
VLGVRSSYLPNDIDEPRLRLARLLPRRRRDSRGRWLWRLVRPRWLGGHGSGLLSFCRGNETESIRIFAVVWSVARLLA